MARFIKLHTEILKEKLEITEVYVNVEQITYIGQRSGNSKFTLVSLPSAFVEATESPQEIMRLIRGGMY